MIMRRSDPLRLLTPSQQLPISLAEAKRHLRVDHDDEDVEILSQLAGAVQWARDYTQRSFMPETWELWRKSISADMPLYRAPVQSIASITYISDTAYSTDPGGLTIRNAGNWHQILTVSEDDYYLDPYDGNPLVVWNPDANYPSGILSQRHDAVRIRFVAGYSKASEVPASIRHAIKLILGYFWGHRAPTGNMTLSAETMPAAARHLLDPFCLPRSA